MKDFLNYARDTYYVTDFLTEEKIHQASLICHLPAQVSQALFVHFDRIYREMLTELHYTLNYKC